MSNLHSLARKYPSIQSYKLLLTEVASSYNKSKHPTVLIAKSAVQQGASTTSYDQPDLEEILDDEEMVESISEDEDEDNIDDALVKVKNTKSRSTAGKASGSGRGASRAGRKRAV
jgi:hypothetical protein